MSQVWLIRTIKFMFVLLLCAFAYILVKGASQRDMQSSLGDESSLIVEQPFADIGPGETVLKKIGASPIWVTRVDQKLLVQMQDLAKEVVGEGCKLEVGLCFLDAKTAMDGILLSHIERAPPQLASSIQWHGGFVDPSNGAVYDRLGRAYPLNKQLQHQAMRVVEIR